MPITGLVLLYLVLVAKQLLIFSRNPKRCGHEVVKNMFVCFSFLFFFSFSPHQLKCLAFIYHFTKFLLVPISSSLPVVRTTHTNTLNSATTRRRGWRADRACSTFPSDRAEGIKTVSNSESVWQEGVGQWGLCGLCLHWALQI